MIQEIGIGIDLSQGTYFNTMYKNECLQLAERGTDGDGKIIYASNGYWESSQILIQDKIRAFKNVAKSINVTGAASYKIFVKTSDDGAIWNEYIEVPQDNSVSNPPAKYAMIKVEIYPEKVETDLYFDRFDDANKYDNELIDDASGQLSLKKSYTVPVDVSVISEGFITTKTVPKSQLKKIDSIKLL